MAIYEIINPSDPYTIEGHFETVCVAVLLLGHGAYGLQIVEGWPGWKLGDRATEMPAMVFGIDTDWVDNQFDTTLEEVLRRADRRAMADCLDTILIGKLQDRKLFQKIVEKPGIDRDQLWAEWHDAKRTSLNDIGSNAKKLAKSLREHADKQGLLPERKWVSLDGNG